MTPPPAAFRLPLAACLLGVALAFVASGCGEESTAAGERDGARRPAQTKSADRPAERAATAGCPKRLDAFVNSLDALRRQLAVGLAYDDYVARVKDLRASYEEIPVDRLTFDCLASGTPAEQALNKHIDAANAWGECLADAACTTETIEPVLQRKWRIASRYVSEAR
jgi:hypothetical protein